MSQLNVNQAELAKKGALKMLYRLGGCQGFLWTTFSFAILLHGNLLNCFV